MGTDAGRPGEPVTTCGAPRRHAPAATRNRQPILEVLRTLLPTEGTVLEIGSGSGEHVTYFAAHWPKLIWQPSDLSNGSLASIAARCAERGCTNVRPPRRLDAALAPWRDVPHGTVDAVLCINVIHIAPWPVCRGLMAGARAALRPGAPLILYGPFMRDGRHTAPSNAAFDRMLKDSDPRFGVRDLGHVTAEAAAHGLMADRVVDMPANNLTVVFRRSDGPPRI